MCVDYESQLARRVAGNVWSGLSRGGTRGGFTKTTAVWESLREGVSREGPEPPPSRCLPSAMTRPGRR